MPCTLPYDSRVCCESRSLRCTLVYSEKLLRSRKKSHFLHLAKYGPAHPPSEGDGGGGPKSAEFGLSRLTGVECGVGLRYGGDGAETGAEWGIRA